MSAEIENAVLSSLLYEPELFHKCRNVIVHHFEVPENQMIFGTVERLINEGRVVDLFLLMDELQQIEASYINHLYENGPANIDNFDAWLERLEERYKERITTEGLNDAANAKTLSEAREIAQRTIDAISVTDRSTTFEINELLKAGVDRIEERFNNPNNITGLETGFNTLDDATAGLQAGDYVVIGARPSMGKTALSMNMVEHALMQNKHVCVFSLEMTAHQLTDRLISAVGRIDSDRIKKGTLQDDDWEKLVVASNKLQGKKLFIDEQNSISPAYMDGILRQREREHGKIDLILVDYLQLMRLKNYRQGRVNELTEISGSLKGIAKKYKCPVVVLSQLNRSCEQRPDKRPINSDLRDSGAIEQDADLICFLYRDEYYNPDTEQKGVAELICTKNRNGTVGTHYLHFLGKYTRFENMKEGK